ncbi:MAG: BON domain-containing protein [Acidobacteriota bacterium]
MANRTVRRPVVSVAVFAVTTALVLLVSCRPNQSVEGQAHDTGIKAAIKSKLASDVGAATLTSIQVNVTNGVVTLAGPVHSEDEKARVEASARTVEGVASVTNALQVLAPERPTPAAGNPPEAPSPLPTAATR